MTEDDLQADIKAFLAKGGVIQQIEPEEMFKEGANKLTQKENREQINKRNHNYRSFAVFSPNQEKE